jgi:hypothetical protein
MDVEMLVDWILTSPHSEGMNRRLGSFPFSASSIEDEEISSFRGLEGYQASWAIAHANIDIILEAVSPISGNKAHLTSPLPARSPPADEMRHRQVQITNDDIWILPKTPAKRLFTARYYNSKTTQHLSALRDLSKTSSAGY